MKRIASLLLILLVSPACNAFDGSDSGEYQILRNKDGKPLSHSFRIFYVANKWVFQEQMDNGKFIEHSCTGPCKFKNSPRSHVKNMFRNGELDIFNDMECIENKHFAICSFRMPANNNKGYVIVFFGPDGPVPMALRQVTRIIAKEK